MDNTSRDIDLSGDYEEIPPIRDATSNQIANTNPQTVRDFQRKLQDLNRENFDLKLRIFFLESQNTDRTYQGSSTQRNTRPASQNIHHDYYQVPHTDYDNSRIRSPISPSRHSSDFVSNQENDNARRRSKPNSDESDDNASPLNRRSSAQTRSKTPSANSDLFTPMPTSTANMKFDDRKLQEENLSLKQEISAVTARLNDAGNQLRHVQDQYEHELRKTQEQQAKADRVIKRLQADYEERIANLEHEQRQKLAQYESYRHEPLLARIRFTYPMQDHKNTNVNIDEYLRQIEQQQRIIDDLNQRLKEQKPYTVVLPSSISPQNNEQLENQIKSYVETIDQLRAECVELQRSEKYLRKQIDDLNHLIEPSSGFLLTKNRSSIVDDVQQTDDPQTTIVQISVQLRNDAENVSGLTNRIAQMFREREDNQNKLKEKDAQIRQYETREIEFENRTKQKYELQIEGLQHDIDHLQKQIDNRDRRLKELIEENHRLTSQPNEQNQDLERQFQQERETLQEQINIAEQHINDLREELNKQHNQYDSLLADYEKLKETLDKSASIDALENAIKEKERQLEVFQVQLQDNETNFQQQRISLERERDFEKGKADEVQNELDDYKRNFDDLEQRYAQLQPLLNQQQTKYDQQIQELQNDLAQIEQEKGNLVDELEFLKQEKLTMAENDSKLQELAQSNDDLRGQLARFEVHIQDSEDQIKRLTHDLDTIRDENQALTQELNALKTDYNRVKNNLTTSERERDQLETDNLGLKQENNELKHQLKELEPQLREQLKDEYENDSHERVNDLTKAKDDEIENLQFELEQSKTQRKRLEKQIADLEDELQQANETIDTNEKDLARLNQLPRIQDVERQYQTQIAQLEEQIQTVENDKVQTSSNNQQLIQQLENKIQEQDDLIKDLRNNQANSEQESTEIQLRLQIQIQGLEEELENKERLVEQYTEAVQDNDARIDQLEDKRNKQIEELTEERNLLQEDYERQIDELKRKLEETYRELDDARETTDSQILQIEDLTQENNRLTRSAADKQTYLKQIEDLERQLQMEKKSNESLQTEQRNQHQNVIDDLKQRLKQREEELQNLQHPISSSDQTQIQMQIDQLTAEIESLRERLAEKDQEIKKLREDNLAKDHKSTELMSKPEVDPRRVPPKTETATMIASLKIELQKQEKEITDLKQQLDEARKDRPDQTDSSSSSVVLREPRIRSRQNFENLNREELLYELERTLEQIEDLNNQLSNKFPTLTEQHKQLVEVRHELSRQKYVNQVLWRKLNALIDIHGSNTRNELAIELASYQDEIAKLKAYRTPSIIKRVESRSSSEPSVNKTDSGFSTATDSIELQKQLREKDDEIQALNNELNERYDEIRQLTNQLNNAKRNVENQQDLFDELEQARLQIEQMKPQSEENPRLQNEIKRLEAELERSKTLSGRPISTQFDEHERRRAPAGENDTSEVVIRRTDLAQLLEEIRLLRRDLERSLQKQNELQSKLDENLRQSQSPREFTFSGRGVSYPDLRLIENANLFPQETHSLSTSHYSNRSRPVGSSSNELDRIDYSHSSPRETEQRTIMKSYVVGDIRTHNELDQLIKEIKLDFKAINSELKQKLRSRTNSTDIPSRSIDEHLISLDERLTRAIDLLQTYEITDLPEKNKDGQRLPFDLRLEDEIQRLRAAQRKYIQDIQILKQKNREQTNYLDQLLTQLTSDLH